ncbi:MAG: hypothetical protein IJ524_00215 [Bacteroidales bacterium]|nr:hypothetical protein [Bacteroidales bacterium]
MKRNISITPKEPSWKLALMNSPVLSAKAEEKGYLPNYLDGIFPGGRDAMMPNGKFYRMFDAGKGSELKPSKVAGKDIPPKACAVHSSSMLAYNFFHWISKEHPFRFSDGKTYDKVYFEVKMPVLKSHPQSPANMDVMLVSDDCHSVLCFESKLSEYTKHGDADFKSAYLERKNYYNNHFVDDFVKYVKGFENKAHSYNDGMTQMVRHLIAITNLHQSNYAMADMLAQNDFIEPDVAKKMLEAPLIIKFANILYVLGTDRGLVPYSETLNYIKLLANFRSTACFDDMIWQYFVLPNYAYNYNDMLAIMRSQMPDGLPEYLEARYPALINAEEHSYPIFRV